MRHFTSILILLCGTLLPAVAGAATGVSEERVSLPEGPGSLEGIGENVELNLNMGAMIHRVPIQVPEGFAGLTPQVTLSYSSSNGSSVVGMGWSLSMPSIERLTVRGLPEYDLDDELSVNGGEELVLITGTDPPVYRSRFEGSFVRYTWHDAGDGSQGYFTAEHPDGRIGYYGADASGSLVADARVGGEKGTFRYHLVEIVDRYGHRLRYTWGLHGNVSLMNHIGWVFSDGTNPVYELTFEYDGERYDRLSDCRGGFEELLEHRLEQVNVLARGTRIRRYELSYEDYVTSGGFSRLTGVQLYGLEEFRYGIHHGFAYSRALGVDCAEGEDCGQPYVVSLGQLGVDMAKGETTLLDINGDALPDILNTSSTEEKHRFFMNVLSADGTHAFASPAQSALGTSSDLISSSFVHVLDVDGDGFTDLLNAKTGETLFNRGSGDWAEGRSLWEGAGGFPELGAEGAMASVKFNDVNGDKRIDLVYSRHNDDANDTMVFFNDLAGGFVEAPSQPIGLGFENPAVELNDMNGDSLLDIVQVMSSGLRYRLSYGRGSWSEWKEVIFEDFSLNEQDVVTAELEDMNGDGLADLSLTKGAEVQYWLNRNGTTFDSLRTITSADVDGDLPERKETTTLLHADMNGNGSSDFVWVQGDESGAVYYLELFPVRPNLLAKVTNGIGRVSEITYVSSVQERARDEATDPWKHPLPHPMTVVKQVDEHDELTNVHTVTEYSYRDGYYDGVEKRFRGYSVVQARKAGDELQEAGASRDVYNPGVGDPYVAGKLMEQEHSSGERSVVFKTFEYDECEVAGVPEDGLRFRVRHICRKHQSEQWREGTAEAEWATVETSWEHDGYGNVTLESRHGVTSVGGGACAACEGDAYAGTPCGEKCLGDEAYTRTEYTAPQDNEDRWIVSTPKRVRTFGVATAEGEPAGDVYTETLTYYDGPDFEGLPHGQVTHGAVTRVVERLDTSGATREKVRNRIDEHGNVVETLDPLGAPGGDGHRRLYTMDEDGLKVVRVDVFNSGAGGAYTLRQEIQYDPLWAKPVEATAWMVVEGDEVKDARRPSYYAYDELGRIVSITHPGSTPDKPTEEYEYNLASPVTSIVIKKRSVAGEDPDLETVRCVDGRGRTYQERTRVAEGSWRVTGFTAFNLQGNPREIYDPYIASTGDCESEAPDGVLSTSIVHDGTGRAIERRLPELEFEDGPVRSRTVHEPLKLVEYDLEDTNEGGPHADTPTTVHRNGLGRIIRVERLVAAGSAPLVHSASFDELGRLSAVADPEGITYTRTNDLLGRAVRVEDPDAGASLFEYDAAGNLVRFEDARAKVILKSFDGLNRLAAEWDESDEAGTKRERRYDRRGDCPAERCSNVAGQLAAVSFPLGDGRSGEDLYGYTVRGNVSYSSRAIGSRSFVFETDYDNVERVTANVYPTGLRVGVERDGAGRLTKVDGYVDKLSYDERGLPAEIVMANGTSTVVSHDERKHLAALSATGPGDEVLLAYSYTRDRLGHLLEVSDGRSTDGSVARGGAHYSYDGLYRLEDAVLDLDRPDLEETLNFAFDGADRLLAKLSSLGADSPAHAGDYAYEDAAHPRAVSSAAGMSFTYDAAGNMITRGDTSFTWDAFGRLVSATKGAGPAARFAYDAEGKRIEKRESGHLSHYLSSDFEVRDGTGVTYVSVGNDRRARIEEPAFAAEALTDLAPARLEGDVLSSEPDGAITAADAWLAGAAASGTFELPSGAEADDPRTLLHAAARRLLDGDEALTRYLHLDHLGSVAAETDGEGKLVAGTEHYPYGTRRFTDGEPDPHGFTGKETDEGTGLTYFGKRYLDPLIGRWTAPDPHFQVLEDLSVNRIAESTGAYSFNAGDPVNYRDETGTVRTTVRTGFWGKFKMARALKKGRIRPNMTWAITFGIKPHKRIGWKTAWRLAKTAQKTFGRHGGYKTDGGMVKVRTPFVSTELRGLQLNRQLTREIADATNNTNTRLRQSFSTLPAFGKEKSQNKLVKWATKLGMSRKEAVQTMFYGSTGMIQRAKQQGHSKRTLNLKQASKGIKAKGWSTKGRK